MPPVSNARGDISVSKLKNVENLVVTHKGTSDETIVIGAHYDFEERGCGAVDNWTGIVTIARLYRTTRQYAGDKTVLTPIRLPFPTLPVSDQRAGRFQVHHCHW